MSDRGRPHDGVSFGQFSCKLYEKHCSDFLGYLHQYPLWITAFQTDGCCPSQTLCFSLGFGKDSLSRAHFRFIHTMIPFRVGVRTRTERMW
ncbi:MAG: hypothetical protein ABSC17_05835 [Thermacetogeniaceae bacterium]